MGFTWNTHGESVGSLALCKWGGNGFTVIVPTTIPLQWTFFKNLELGLWNTQQYAFWCTWLPFLGISNQTICHPPVNGYWVLLTLQLIQRWRVFSFSHFTNNLFFWFTLLRTAMGNEKGNRFLPINNFNYYSTWCKSSKTMEGSTSRDTGSCEAVGRDGWWIDVPFIQFLHLVGRLFCTKMSKNLKGGKRSNLLIPSRLLASLAFLFMSLSQPVFFGTRLFTRSSSLYVSMQSEVCTNGQTWSRTVSLAGKPTIKIMQINDHWKDIAL